MTERATVFQTVQIGVETTPGTAVAATKKLSAIDFQIGPNIETKTYQALGQKFAALVVPTKEWTKLKLSGPITYTELVYLMASALAYAAPAQQGGTAAYKWTSAPDTDGEDTRKTFTVEQGSALRAHKSAGALIAGLELVFSRDGCEVSGDLIGKALTDDIHLSTNAKYTLTAAASPPTTGTFTLTYGGQTTAAIQYDATAAAVETALEALSTIGAGNVEVTATVAAGAGNLSVANNVYTVEFVNALAQAPRTLTGTFTGLTPASSIVLAASVVGVTPTVVALVPVLPTHIDIYMADTQAGLDSADALLRPLKISWKLSDRDAALFPLATASGTSYAATVEKKPGNEMKLLMEADAEGMALLTTARAGDSKFIRIEAIGDLIASTYYYTLTIDTAVKVTAVSEFKDEDGVFALEWTFSWVHDPTWGKATQVDITNELTAL